MYKLIISNKVTPCMHAMISNTWTLKLAQRHERSAQFRDGIATRMRYREE